MNVVSVNVGLPREILWQGRTVTTSIFKSPVEGHVRVGPMNLDGDGQSDLTKHGGASKAVCAYPAEHYDYWRTQLPELDLPWGAFGENLTTRGLFEKNASIGDRLRVGSAELIVREARMPCYKMGIRFQRPDVVNRFLKSGRTGFYLSVESEGEVAAGDEITVLSAARNTMTVAEMVSLYVADPVDLQSLERASTLADLPESWQQYFAVRLAAERRELSEVWRDYFRQKPWAADA